MPRFLHRQDRGLLTPDDRAAASLEALAPCDALVVDGVDPTAARRAYMRALHAQRQAAEQGAQQTKRAARAALEVFLRDAGMSPRA